MKNAKATDSRVWFTALLATLLAIFVIDPIVAPFDSVLRIAHLFMAAAVVMASFAICRSRLTRVATVVLGALAVGLSALAAGRGTSAGLVADAAMVAFVLFSTTHIVAVIFSHRVVTRESVSGALCAYLLFGFGFAFLYSIVDRLAPGAFNGLADATAVAEDPVAQEHRIDAFLYFSMVTMTTVGYGEITPRIASARALANLQAIAGQLYIAVTIARLVGLQVSRTTLDAKEES